MGVVRFVMRLNRILIVSLFSAVLLSACAPRALREATQIVVQADSLWRAGQPYADSAQLAQAYETLGQWALFCQDEYAHACYHYGKLLRAKENPVEAMQCFINATHSHTRDYHILGRVYSNMGTMCHLVSDFPLAYEMYEQSGEMYLHYRDTLSYYHCLNNMAFEKALLGELESCLLLLDYIPYSYVDNDLTHSCLLTKAQAFLTNRQNDSAIYYAKQVINSQDIESSATMIIAQAFDNIEQNDSALVYAYKVLSDTVSSYQDKFNALYIVSKKDSSLTTNEISEIDSQREDIRYYEYEPEKEKNSHALLLLRQDLQHKPDWRWLYAIIGTIAIIGIGIFIYVRRKQKRHQLLSQQVKKLTTMNHVAMQQHARIMQEHTDYTCKLVAQLEQNCHFFAEADDFPNNLYWKDFEAFCNLINNNFGILATKLQKKYHLSEKEVRLCVLVLIGDLSGKQLADILCYAESGIRNFKNRTAQKLGTNSIELRNILLKIAISEYSGDWQ